MMRMHHSNLGRAVGLPLRAIALAVAVAAAAPPALAADPKASQYYEDALQRFEKKDYAGTVIQLKNVLKTDARNLSAQVLLGKALLEGNQVGPAEVAFNEALRLGVKRAEVVVPLAKALVGQGRPDEIITDPRFAVDGLPRTTQYQMLLLRAGAAAEMTDIRTGLKAIDEARALDASDPASWISEVPLRIRSRQFKEALAAADRAIALAPTQAEPHFTRAEALHVVPDLRAALASYDKALALNAEHVSARVARAGLYVDLGRIDDAAKDLARIAKDAPGDPRGVYLKSIVAERQGRTEDSRAALNELTTMLDPIPLKYLRYRPQTQMLGGMAHYGLGQNEKAKPYLEGVLRTQPGHPVAKVLASIYLNERGADRAILALDGYTRANPGDAQAMLLLASAHMTQGRHARATQILQEAIKLSDQPRLRTALGLSLVGEARYSDAIKELEAAFAKDPRQLPAGLALASMYMQSGQGAGAVRVAESLNKTYPRNASVLHLLGGARRSKGDVAGARSAYELAIAADPGFVMPHVGLARLDMEAQDYPKALVRLNAVIGRDDKNLDTLAAIAELAERNGQLPDAQRWLAKADEHAGPTNAAPALALVDFHLRHNQPTQAKEALSRAQGKAPEAVGTLVAVARVALAQGDAITARSNLTRAATGAGYNAPLLTEIAALQSLAGALPGAAHSLDKALSERPNYLRAMALRTEVDIRQGDLVKAEQRARQIVAQQPRSGLGHTLLGDIAATRNQREPALAAYRKAHELDRSTDSLMRLFAMTARRDVPAAARVADQWLTAKPNDMLVRRALADLHLDASNLGDARRNYEALLKLRPGDAEVLNNLANVMLRQNDPGALKVAEHALGRAPGAAHVIGTAGWATFKSGQPERALQLLRDARLRDPDNADTRYFLGTVLVSLGRKGEARDELTAALQGKPATNYRPDAEKLLATLR